MLTTPFLGGVRCCLNALGAMSKLFFAKKARCFDNGTKRQNRAANCATYPLVSGLYRRRLDFTDSASITKKQNACSWAVTTGGEFHPAPKIIH